MNLRMGSGGAARLGSAAPPFLRSGDRVDLVVDLLGADLPGVGRHDWIDELLHLGAVLERDALQLARLLERVELRRVLGGFDLATMRPAFLAGLDDRLLQVGRELLEGLAREAERADG